MRRQFVMDVDEDRRNVETFRMGRGVDVAHLAVGFDQLTTELMQLLKAAGVEQREGGAK